MNNCSKNLNHDDISGFEFAKEMLAGDVTAAVNFDRIQYHPKYGYIIFEYLLCEEEQHVTPYTSHPKRYWYKNKRKFLKLWKIASDLKAVLYLVNYAKAGTASADEILLIEVKGMDDNGITEENQVNHTRSSFSKWFRQLNEECLDKDLSGECASSSEEEKEEKEHKCPNCGEAVRKGKYGYYCTGKCGMDIGKLYGKALDENIIIQLLEGNEAEQDDGFILPKIEMYTFVNKNTNSAVTRYHWKTMKKDFFAE